MQVVILNPHQTSLQSALWTENVLVVCDAADGAFSVNLPDLNQSKRVEITFIKTDSTTNAVTITAINGQVIASIADGVATAAATVVVDAQYESSTLVCDTARWYASETGDAEPSGVTASPALTAGTVPVAAAGNELDDSIIIAGATVVNVNGKMVVGAAATVANSLSPIEIIGVDGGLCITSTGTGVSKESYICGYMRDAGGTYKKLGAEAWHWADDNVTDGYCSWNTHSTAYVNGVSNDYYGLTCWALHGAEFFGSTEAAASAPGNRVLKINGTLIVLSDGIDVLGIGTTDRYSARITDGTRVLYFGTDTTSNICYEMIAGASGVLVWKTHDGSTFNERMRIHSDGTVRITGKAATAGQLVLWAAAGATTADQWTVAAGTDGNLNLDRADAAGVVTGPSWQSDLTGYVFFGPYATDNSWKIGLDGEVMNGWKRVGGTWEKRNVGEHKMTRTVAGASNARTNIGTLDIATTKCFDVEFDVECPTTGFNSVAHYHVTGKYDGTAGAWQKVAAREFSDDTQAAKPSFGLDVMIDENTVTFATVLDRTLT